MSFRYLVSYWTVLGLAFQSTRLEQSMNVKLVQMGTAAERAAQLEAAAEKDTALSTENAEKAGLDQAEGGTLQEEASALTTKSEEDAALAAADEAAADDLTAKAAQETARAETLFAKAQEDETLAKEEFAKATALSAQSEQDAALAATEQVGADELVAQAAQEQSQAASHFAKAAADETLAQEEYAQATADAAAASRTAAQAHGEEVGTGVCELIPLLDVVCDVIGGAASVGSEVTAAKEAAASAVDFAEAAAANAEQGTEMATATELEAKAVQDGEAAVELQAEATALEEEAEAEMAQAQAEEAAAQEKANQGALEQEAAEQKEAKAAKDAETATETKAQATTLEEEAEEEMAQAEAEEAEAQEEMEKGAVEEEAAEEELAQATEERAESASFWEESMTYGLGAFWDMAMAGLVAFVALGFFAFRIMVSLVVPGATVFFSEYVPSVMTVDGSQRARHMQVASNIWTTLPMKQFSYAFLHCAIFMLTAGLLGGVLATIGEQGIRSRGGIILLFAGVAATLQGILLHAMPHLGNEVSQLRSMSTAFGVTGRVLLTFSTSVLWLTPLFAMEVLILWVNFGHGIFSPQVLSKLSAWYLWLAFGLVVALHFVVFERWDSCDENNSDGERVDSKEQRALALPVGDETQALLAKGDNIGANSVLSYHSNSSTGGDLSSVGLDEEMDGGISNTCDKRREQERREQETMRDRSWSVGSRTAFTAYLEKLQLPFEILIISCMISLLSHCVPNVGRVWPVFHSLVISSHPHWYVPANCVGGVAVSVLILWLCCTRRKGQKGIP